MLEVTRDIRYFFGVIVLVCVGFGLSFYLLCSVPGNEDFGSLGMSLLQVAMYLFGSTPDVASFGDSHSYALTALLYALFMFLNAIVLLNLLIAIMGDSFRQERAYLMFHLLWC